MKNKDIDFEQFEKETPYRVPPGFFENITAKTLEIARIRNRKKKRLILGYTLTAAASVLVLITLGIITLRNNQGIEKNTVQNQSPVFENAGRSDSMAGEFHEITDSGRRNVPDEQKTGKPLPPETLGNILDHLGKDELSYFASLMTTELFLDEFHNN